MTFDWIGDGFMYGMKMTFFQITTEGVPLIFNIRKSSSESDYPFTIERIKKNVNSINITSVLDGDVKSVFIFNTDDIFRKEFKRSYSILKFVMEDEIITLGAYTDNVKKMTPDNLYILCDDGFINILANGYRIFSDDQLEGTAFTSLAPIFNKKELAKVLLK